MRTFDAEVGSVKFSSQSNMFTQRNRAKCRDNENIFNASTRRGLENSIQIPRSIYRVRSVRITKQFLKFYSHSYKIYCFISKVKG